MGTTNRLELLHRFLEGVRIESSALLAAGAAAPLALSHGVFEGVDGAQQLFRFSTSQSFRGRSDTPVTVRVVEGGDVGSRYEGSIKSYSHGSLLVALGRSTDSPIPQAALEIGHDGLVLRAVSDILTALISSDATLPHFNRQLASSVVSGTERGVTDTTAVPLPPELTPDQQQACLKALSSRVSYIWGPAGTGKTVTLGALAHTLFTEHKRVLIVAHTHQAVDGVLWALCKRIIDAGVRSQLPEGSVVKLGSIHHAALNKTFGDAISFDSLAVAGKRAMAERLKTMMEDLVKVEREIWSASHQRTLRDLQSNLLRERGEILEELSPAGSGLLRRLASRSVHGARSVADVELRAQLALIEASLEEVDRKLGPKEGTGATEGDLTELLERQKDLSGGIELLEGFISDISTHVLSRARIVGATSAKTALMLAQLGQFDAVLIDEASMMPMVMSYLAAGLARERVVVAGDFRQLPPISKDQSERGRSLYARSVFESSSITKGISTGLHLPHVSILTSHFRAHPAIMGLFNERFYGGRLQSAYVDPSPPAIESDKSCEELLAQRVAVVDTSSLEPQGIYTHGSKANPVHAVIIRTLVQRLLRGSSLNAADVGVIAPYRPQVDLVHSLLREAELSDVACGTVHRFQGDERRVIVLDLVESGPHRLGAFLSGTEVGELSGRLLNVALSRAREQLFIVSNNEHLLSQLRSDSLVRGIVAQCVQAGHLLQAEDIALHGEEGAWGGGSSAMQLFAHEEFYAALVADLIEAQLEVQLSSPLLSTLGASVVAGALARGVASRGVKARVVVAHGGSQEAINAMQAAGIEVAVVKGDVGEFSAVGVVIDGEVAWLAPRSPLAADQTGVRCGVRVVSPSLARLVKPLTARLLQRAPVGDTPSRLLTHRGTAVDAIKHETLSPVAR